MTLPIPKNPATMLQPRNNPGGWLAVPGIGRSDQVGAANGDELV
jgi:hypothetical protein